MASNLEELRTALMHHLATHPDLADALGGRVFSGPRTDIQCAWIGITEEKTDGDGVEFLISIHVGLGSSTDEVRGLTDKIAITLDKPPTADGWSVSEWTLDHSEVRQVQDNNAIRGLLRYRARIESS